MNELSLFTAAAAMPVQGGGVALALQYAGFNAFNEGRVALAYGKKLGGISLGMQCHYHRLSMAGYGSDGAIGFELGAVWSLTTKLTAGIQIANPLGGQFRRHRDEKLAATYRLATGYEASERVFIGADIFKEEDRPLNVLINMQYTLVPRRFFTRLGIATATAEPFFASGWQWKNCRADLLVRYHPQLGLSPALLLVFYGKQKTIN